jgi:hypothetical protein
MLSESPKITGQKSTSRANPAVILDGVASFEVKGAC